MGYMHIDNLPKAPEILEFKWCYALEKIHGTSANVSWVSGQVMYHSGGEKMERFAALFDYASLDRKFMEKFGVGTDVTVYGEAYGGKQQGMSATYGPDLKFVAFEVKVGDHFLAVPQAADVVKFLGLEFVDYEPCSASIAEFDYQRSRPSAQAIRNGITEPRMREGIVLRPPFECVLNNGKRVIAKYKNTEFSERASKSDTRMTPDRAESFSDARKVADEWVTHMRLRHVVDAVLGDRDEKALDISDTGCVIKRMIEDVLREGEGEVADSKDVRKAIGNKTAEMFKKMVGEKHHD